ncbi:unnamed protein product [Thlaspi arvense]|uniref:Peptidase C19 ubiquitin carboxyl-terminal hydrolase domain-containing protein n=1 Tax=Thlaspi arvense TaxID=13288 RepID=A0AAU9SGI7_THLAR|nr:unnamed protein product [Thlaspi arvense]
MVSCGRRPQSTHRQLESSKIQEAEQVEEIEQRIDPEAMKSEEPEEKPNATRVLALDMILKSLWKISVFLSDFLLEFCQATHHSFTEDGEYVVTPSQQLRDFLLSNLSVTHSLEANGVFDFLVTILELLPLWRSENGEEKSLNSKFEVYEVAKKICNRCKMLTEIPVGRSYGIIVSAFEDLTFEKILKFIRITLMMPCDKEMCGKRNYVERMINELPSVFTLALEWENDESGEEIFATISALATEIDVSAIYKYNGVSKFTKYHLVSMVCLHGGQYSCVAFENRNWVIYFGTENEVIGDWDNVLTSFAKLNIRPTLLFFENVMGRGQIIERD